MSGPEDTTPRPLAALATLLGAAALALLLAPWLFNALVRLGRTAERWAGLRDLEFERLVTRVILVALLLALVPALRMAGLRSGADLGLGPAAGRRRHLANAFGWGVLGVAVLFGFGAVFGAFRPAGTLSGSTLGELLLFLPGAGFVALVEEVLFRGGLFGGVRARTRFWPAALFSSLVFSAVHFMRPEPLVSVAHARWNSAFLLLPHVFEPVHALHHYVPFCLTLFLIGLALCLLYEITGSLYASIGMHAGWIFALRSNQVVFDRVPEVWAGFLGHDAQAAKSWAAAVAAGLVVACLVVYARRGRHDA